MPSLNGALFGAMLNGLGFRQVMPTFVSQALTVASPRYRGMVAGLVTSAIFLGQFISPLLVAPLLKALEYRGTFAVMVVALVIAAGIVAFALRPPRA